MPQTANRANRTNRANDAKGGRIGHLKFPAHNRRDFCYNTVNTRAGPLTRKGNVHQGRVFYFMQKQKTHYSKHWVDIPTQIRVLESRGLVIGNLLDART